MAKILKTTSEIDFSFLGYTEDPALGIVELKFMILNPYINIASLSSLKFQSPSTGEWFTATLYANQDVDVNNIQIGSRSRAINIKWDAATDLRIMQAFTNIHITAQFNDRSALNGGYSEVKEFILPTVDMRSTATVKVIRPKLNDPYMTFEFTVPVPPRQAKIHFIVEVDTVPTFDSPNLLTFSTLEKVSGWTADGAPFPEDGVDGIIGVSGDRIVTLSNANLTNLPTGTNYYHRITPVLDQFRAIITNLTNGQVFAGENIPIQGTVVTYD